MSKQILSKKQAHSISFALFIVGIGILFFIDSWWPAIMLVVGIPMAVRQYLLGRKWDMAISLFVFIGIFITVQFDFPWKMILPVLFILGGLYIFLREIIGLRVTTEEEKEEDLNHEIEEDKK